MIFLEVFTRSNNFLASIKLSSKKGRVGVMSNIEKYRAVMRKNRENRRRKKSDFPVVDKSKQLIAEIRRTPRGLRVARNDNAV